MEIPRANRHQQDPNPFHQLKGINLGAQPCDRKRLLGDVSAQGYETWGSRQYALLKRRSTSTKLHVVISQKATILTPYICFSIQRTARYARWTWTTIYELNTHQVNTTLTSPHTICAASLEVTSLKQSDARSNKALHNWTFPCTRSRLPQKHVQWERNQEKEQKRK
jgi:hypothetical protein